MCRATQPQCLPSGVGDVRRNKQHLLGTFPLPISKVAKRTVRSMKLFTRYIGMLLPPTPHFANTKTSSGIPKPHQQQQHQQDVQQYRQQCRKTDIVPSQRVAQRLAILVAALQTTVAAYFQSEEVTLDDSMLFSRVPEPRCSHIPYANHHSLPCGCCISSLCPVVIMKIHYRRFKHLLCAYWETKGGPFK